MHPWLPLLPLLSLLVPLTSCTYMAPTCNGSTTNKDKLYIQGFVPATGDVYTSETIVPAATIACEEINSNSSILADYELIIDWSDTMCHASEATWQLIQVVLEKDGRKPPPRVMFLGGGCSPATEPLAALSGRFYDVTQVSYGASTPTLSDRKMFPKFLRTIPSEIQSNSARFALMGRYNWTRVATLHETRNIFTLTVTNFREQYYHLLYGSDNPSEDGASAEQDLVIRSFTDDPEIPLTQIKDKDIRIILAYMYEDKARNTVCQALKKNLTSVNHLWMFPAWYEHDWWYQYVPVGDKFNCTPDEMAAAVRYSIFLDSYNYGQSDRPTSTGLTNVTFFEKYQRALREFNADESNPFAKKKETVPHAYITFTYDAVWSMALALHKTEMELISGSNISLRNFTYQDQLNITRTIFEHMGNTSFSGISGEVKFDENGTRVGLNGIYQLVDSTTKESKLELVLLYVHDPNTTTLPTNYSEWRRPPVWKRGFPPKDRREPDNKYINHELIIACGVFVGLAILVALSLLVFNFATIWKPLVRDSAPLINTIIIIGCILMLGSCYLLGVDTQTPQISGDNPATIDDDLPKEILTQRNDRYKIVCMVRLWLLTLGFTLSFGALFSKTWQVYRVYTNPKLKTQSFKMWNFLILLGIFLAIDVVYLIIWSVRFPFERATDNQENDAADTVEVYEVCRCGNFGYLIGALYVYKGLLVVFGLFLAYESRNVKYMYINDSRFVSIAMYIVVIVVGIGAPLSLVLSVHFFINPAYGLAVFMVILATMSCLLILFIPKFIYLAKGRDTMLSENTREEITASDGLQLGHTSVDQSDIHSAEEEVKNLENKMAENNIELQALEANIKSYPLTSPTKNHNGSDGDSGVLVTTTDETEMYNELSAGGENSERERRPSNTPTPTPTTASCSPNMIGDGTDEGAEL